MKIKLAAMDIDGTLFPGALGLDLLEELVARGISAPGHWQDVQSLLREYADGKVNRPDMVLRTAQSYAAAVKGARVAQVAAIAREVWQREQSRLFPFVRDIVSLLRKHRFSPLVISSSPAEIVANLAESLGSVPYRGSTWRDIDGIYTGEIGMIMGLPGVKAQVIGEFLGGAELDVEGSIAIGNSISDEGMLAVVGNPVVFEPEPSLESIALQRGWLIVDGSNVLERVAALLDY